MINYFDCYNDYFCAFKNFSFKDVKNNKKLLYFEDENEVEE
jgi:hypothetical protein